jgi:hypothetical protein
MGTDDWLSAGHQGFDSRRDWVFSLHNCIQTGSEAQWVPGALSSGVKRPERSADHSTISRAVKSTSSWCHSYLRSGSTLHLIYLVVGWWLIQRPTKCRQACTRFKPNVLVELLTLQLRVRIVLDLAENRLVLFVYRGFPRTLEATAGRVLTHTL